MEAAQLLNDRPVLKSMLDVNIGCKRMLYE